MKWPFLPPRFRRTIVLTFLLFLSSCRTWVIVESEYRGTTLDEAAPQTTRTGEFSSAAEPGVTVALSAPDSCSDRSEAETTGKVQPAGQILRTHCGVAMAELERALVKAGYRVVSWNAIRQTVVYERGVTPLAAAKRLDAKILLQINSLERSLATRGKTVEWERRFYESDDEGRKGPPATASAERAQALEAGIAPLEQQAISRLPSIGATVNATAILVETGQALWFYQWTHSQGYAGELSTSNLFVCSTIRQSRCRFWRFLDPQTSGVAAAGAPRSGSVGYVSTPEVSASAEDEAYSKMVSDVLADLVREFGKSS